MSKRVLIQDFEAFPRNHPHPREVLESGGMLIRVRIPTPEERAARSITVELIITDSALIAALERE